jgi:hypothetical protein
MGLPLACPPVEETYPKSITYPWHGTNWSDLIERVWRWVWKNFRKFNSKFLKVHKVQNSKKSLSSKLNRTNNFHTIPPVPYKLKKNYRLLQRYMTFRAYFFWKTRLKKAAWGKRVIIFVQLALWLMTDKISVSKYIVKFFHFNNLFLKLWNFEAAVLFHIYSAWTNNKF